MLMDDDGARVCNTKGISDLLRSIYSRRVSRIFSTPAPKVPSLVPHKTSLSIDT